MNIFVGNLSSQTTEQQLGGLFSAFGQVSSVKIILDNYTRRSKGFAFVEMLNQSEAESAIAKLNNSMVEGQALTVNEARPRTSSFNSSKSRY